MKRVAIVQSNYIPWKGYFDMIASVDEFILFDDMQFTRRDWRNRNLIKTPQGTQWLTVPVEVKGKFTQAIRDTRIVDGDWAAHHWKSLCLNYRRSVHFDTAFAFLEPLYSSQHETLTALNRFFLQSICDFLGIEARITNSWDYVPADGKSERLASLCAQAGADVYVSGPAARGYLNEDVFADKGISVEWFDYSGYPQYRQLWGEFTHGVTILDLIFNTGLEATRYMKHAPCQHGRISP